jgi:hypothetical protein
MTTKDVNTKITVIDSMMGTGKTSWAIQLMKESPLAQNFIFITPFLSEIERIQSAIPNRNFVTPTTSNRKGSKLEGLKQLLLKGQDIASTHALFQRCDEEIITLLKATGYTLILDESMNMVEKMNIVKDDIEILFKSATIVEDEGKWIKWVGTGREYNGGLRDVKEACFLGNVYHYSEDFYMWTFPQEVFETFDKVFIMTYMFDGQLQKYYLDVFKTEYNYKSVTKIGERYELTEYTKDVDMTAIRDLLHIYEGKLNAIGDGEYAFSATDLKKLKTRPSVAKLIQNNIYNFFRNVIESKSSDNMWTTFKDVKPTLKGKGYTKGFVACNSRATNDYRERTAMAYMCNRFSDPYVLQFFTANGVDVNDEAVALSELVQWIFRSAIREGKEVDLYIPSERMRKLLQDWLLNTEEK